MYKIYSDAAVNQNNQHAAIGILILHDGQQIQFKQRIASTNNHEAEFIAAIKAFEKLATLNQDPNEFVFTTLIARSSLTASTKVMPNIFKQRLIT